MKKISLHLDFCTMLDERDEKWFLEEIKDYTRKYQPNRIKNILGLINKGKCYLDILYSLCENNEISLDYDIGKKLQRTDFLDIRMFNYNSEKAIELFKILNYSSYSFMLYMKEFRVEGIYMEFIVVHWDLKDELLKIV